MKKLLTALLILCVAVGVIAAQYVAKEKKAIKNMMEESYLKGVYINKDADAFVKGFASEFKMMWDHDGHLHTYSQGKWAESIRANKAKDPKPSKIKYTCKVPMIDITVGVGVAKVEIYQEGKKIYTDYMSLVKVGKNWKVD